MTIRFAPARDRHALAGVVAWNASDLPLSPGANDDAGSAEDEALLAEALRHFAAHGMSAAERAHDLAVAAARVDDTSAFDHWHAICRMFDKRMAKTLVRNRKTAGY